MKSDRKYLLLLVCLHAFILASIPCLSAEKAGCKIAVATINLPNGSDGLLHWRSAADADTKPLQLSARYFSEHLELQGLVVQFFQTPVSAGPDQNPPPEPLVTLKIPEGAKLVYIVMMTDTTENKQTRWRGILFNAADWKESSLKLINSSSESLRIALGQKQIQLNSGKSMDFNATEWRDPFPVKIFQMTPDAKKIFSSTWRVSSGRRELCFLYKINGSIALRSLLDLGEAQPLPTP